MNAATVGLASPGTCLWYSETLEGLRGLVRHVASIGWTDQLVAEAVSAADLHDLPVRDVIAAVGSSAAVLAEYLNEPI